MVSKTPVSDNVKDEIELEFNKSLIPYIINISDYNKMDKTFYELIKPSLVKIN